MQFISTLLLAVYCLLLQVEAAPLAKRYFAPSSPTFSLIAIHKGDKFNSHLVKFNGTAIKLGSDDKAFFGTIEADKGYILNLPNTNGSNSSSITDVVVSNKTHQLEVTTKNGSASEHFGITNGWLTFLNSTNFLACPEVLSYSNSSSNSSGSASNITSKSRSRFARRALENSTIPANATGDWDLYHNPTNQTKCPVGTGYDVKLLVQLSLPVSFSPETNNGDLFSGESIFKRFLRLFK